MKTMILFILLFILAANCFGQPADLPRKLTRSDYLLKSEHQNTAAWLLLSGGVVMTTIGVIVGSNGVVDEIFTGNSNKFDAAVILIPAGLLSMAGSIPLFIVSSKNKRKGLSLSFKNETAPQIQKRSFVYRYVPSLNLKIDL